MIISDRHRFVFVHIPKCAGTVVRRILAHLDDTGGAHTNRVDEHPDLGRIDYVHIPLAVLRDRFPAEYEKVREYESYALVRDPFARFPSSLSQHLKMYGATPIQKLGSREVESEVRRVVRFLKERDKPGLYLPPEYIHFQRQSDFVDHRGERVVRNLYATGRVQALVSDLSTRAGISLEAPAEPANRSVVYRSERVRAVVEGVRPVVRAVLPEPVRLWIGDRIMPRLHVPRQARFARLFSSPEVQEFIRSYYAVDIDLFEDVAGRPAGVDG